MGFEASYPEGDLQVCGVKHINSQQATNLNDD